MDIKSVTDPDTYMMHIVSPLEGLGPGGHIMAASRLQLISTPYFVKKRPGT